MTRVAALLLVSLPLFAHGDPLRDTLTARGGKTPVYLAYGEAGITASAADGAWSVPLCDGTVDTAAIDAAQDLVWLVREGRLEVLDLREAEPKPTVIVERWFTATEGFVSKPVIAVSGVSNAEADTMYAAVHPTLLWKAKPRIGTGQGAYGGIWEDQDAAAKKAIKKAKLVGARWLEAQAARKVRAGAPEPKAPDKPGKVKLPKGVGECEDEELCGEARPFGPTGWLIVLVRHACGDACHTECLLYDATTRKFASPTAPVTWGKKVDAGTCFGYDFDAEGKRWLAGDKVCTTKGCATVAKGTAFGWLDGGGAKL